MIKGVTLALYAEVQLYMDERTDPLRLSALSTHRNSNTLYIYIYIYMYMSGSCPLYPQGLYDWVLGPSGSFQ